MIWKIEYNKSMKRYYFKTSEEEKKNGKTMPNLFELYHDIRLVSVNPDELTQYLSRVETRSTIYFCDYFMTLKDFSNEEDFFEFYVECFFRHIDVYFINTPECNLSFIRGLFEALDFKPPEQQIREYVIRCLKCCAKQAELGKEMTSSLKRAALMAAKKNGSQIGGVKGAVYNIPKADDMKKQILQYSKSFDGTYSDIELIQKLDIPRATYYKYKKEIKDKMSMK